MNNNRSNVRSLCFAGLMAALVFIFTFTFKVPVGGMGYAHLGDVFIIIAVWILGGKRACIAAAIGAGLADLVSGFAVWILPTVIVKALMAIVIMLIAQKVFKGSRLGYVVGIIVGAAVHVAGYSAAWFVIGGAAGLTGAIIPLVLQTVIGAVLGIIVVSVFGSTPVGSKLRAMAN